MIAIHPKPNLNNRPQKGIGCFQLFVGLVAIIIFSIVFFSCNSIKQATKYTNKALKADTATTVDIIRKLAPCITTSIDTGKPVIITNTVTKIDTVNTVRIDTLKCKDGEIITLPCISKTVFVNKYDTVRISYPITIKIKDSADNIVKDAQISTLQTSLSKEHGKREWWTYSSIILFILLLIAIIIGLIISRTKKTLA